MNIIIFGASGRTGHQLVRRALGQGHRVKAYVRDPAKLHVRHEKLVCYTGEISDDRALVDAIEGCDAVICALGAATPLKRDAVIVEGVRGIIKAMEQTGVRRFIYLSFLGVRESRKRVGKRYGFLLDYVIAPLMGRVIADHEQKEELIKQSGLEWTIVRPPKLTNGPFTGDYRSGQQVRPASLLMTLSRADAADFMLRLLNDNSFIRKAPMVMA